MLSHVQREEEYICTATQVINLCFEVTIKSNQRPLGRLTDENRSLISKELITWMQIECESGMKRQVKPC